MAYDSCIKCGQSNDRGEKTENRLLICPKCELTIDPDQKYFWREEWQKGEREAEEHIRKGQVKTFDNVEDLLKSLDSDEE